MDILNHHVNPTVAGIILLAVLLFLFRGLIRAVLSGVLAVLVFVFILSRTGHSDISDTAAESMRSFIDLAKHWVSAILSKTGG